MRSDSAAYDAMTYRTYVTATKNMKPDLDEYGKEKKKLCVLLRKSA